MLLAIASTQGIEFLERCIQKMLYALLALCLAGCNHVPISTMLKMAAFDGQDFVALNPKDIRIKVLTVGPVEVKSNSATMRGLIEAPTGLVAYSFDLQAYHSNVINVLKGIFTDAARGTQVFYKLTAGDIEQFYRIQSELGSSPHAKFTYNIGYGFDIDDKFEGEFDDISLSLFLMLKPEDGFMKVLDDVGFE